MAFGLANAQEGNFKIGVHAGIPTGDSSDVFSVNLGADVAYVWAINDKFSAGVTSGYTTYLGKSYDTILGELEFEDAGFIPVAGTAQYSVTPNLFAGVDLGYAISTTEGDGGFLYQPKFGYQNAKIELYVSYKGISNDGTISSANIGFNYKL